MLRYSLEQTVNRPRIILLAILAFSSLLLAVNINQPWVGLDGTAGVKRSIEAKNYLKYGFLNLNFGQANTYHQVSDLKELTYYMHHPPLTSVAIAASYYLFGVSEFSYRIILIIFTLTSVLLVYNIARRCYSERIALTAAFIFSVLPVTMFYGRSNYEPLTQLLLLLSVLLYLRWFDDRRPGRFYLFLAVYAVSLGTDWPAYFLGALLPLHYLFSEKGRFFRHPEIVLVPLVTMLGFSLFLYYCYLVEPQAIQSLFLQGKIYMGAVRDPELIGQIRQNSAHGGEHIAFTAGQFAQVLLNRFLLLFLYPVLVLSAFGFWSLVKDGFIRENRSRDLVTIVLLALPIAYCALFYRSAFIHWVWLFYFGPPFAILAAIGIDRIFGRELVNDTRPRPARIPMPYIFCIVLILLPAVYNLKELHNLQRKVLPGKQHETVGLIPGIAKQLKAHTDSRDQILTNLNLVHEGFKGGTMIHYYSERKIAGDIDDVKKLENHLEAARGQKVWFYLWVGTQEGEGKTDELDRYLTQNYAYTSLSVENHKFRLFQLN